MSSPLLHPRTLVRRELAAAEEERETLEQHEKSLTEELDALNETRTSFRNASACGQTDGSLNDPVDAEAESPGHEDEEEQVRSGVVSLCDSSAVEIICVYACLREREG